MIETLPDFVVFLAVVLYAFRIPIAVVAVVLMCLGIFAPHIDRLIKGE